MTTLFLAWLGCGCGGAHEGPRAVFPEKPAMAVLPIRDPIDGPELEVEIELVREERRERLWSVVDSGFTGVSVPDDVAEALRLEDIGRAKTQGISGSVVERVSRANLVLGPLVVSDVVLNRSKRLSVLGQPILSHRPWEVSWTRGTLTLGARPWRPDESTLVIPFHPRSDNELDEVQVLLEGREQLMMFDTGAVSSTIPEALGKSLKLRSEPFEAVFGGAAGAVLVSRAFVADLELGGVRFENKRFLALKDRAWGLLGRDILYRYDLFVTPGKSLALRPRGDLKKSAGQRIGRWKFSPTCASPGCVDARIEREAGHGRLELVVEADLSRAGRMLFACAQPTQEFPLISMAELLGLATSEGPFHHVVLRFDRLRAGRYQVRVPHAGALWFSSNGSGCRELVLLDFVPLANDQPLPRGVSALLRP